MGNIFKTRQMSEIVVILGCTGTGKSKLAIELAKKFNGEIISADSIQVYKGLDIVTNKVTKEEQKEAVHHFIDFVDPLSRYTVVDFHQKALPLIDSLLEHKKLPIIVGGTNYYIESLLWDVLIQPQKFDSTLLFERDKSFEKENHLSESDYTIENLLSNPITQKSLDAVPSEALHAALKEVDPSMAMSLHPKDRRKVIRSLQVYQQHGLQHSELLENQRSQSGGSTLGGPLRYKNCLMLWLQCEQQVLENRLDDRVDKMVSRGMIQELEDFHKSYNQQRMDSNVLSYEEGIFQSIGFKEFHQYLTEGTQRDDLFQKGVEDLKCVTKKYAKKQKKWIVNRFLRKPDREVPPIYGLDATNLDQWEENVLKPAINLLQNGRSSLQPLPVREALIDVKETHYCETCQRILVGQRTYQIHLRSRKHQKMLHSKHNIKKVSAQ